MNTIRILHVVTHMNRGGLETMLMNYYRNIDRTKIQFDFLTHREYDGDYGEEIESLGGIIYHLPPLNPFSRVYHNKLKIFFNQHKEYQIIHVHQDCLSAVVLKVAKQHNIKIRIAHSHCASQDKNLKYLIKLWYKKFIPKYATNLMACGKDAGNWMFNKNSFFVLNNAIETDKYTYNETERTKQRKKWNIDNKELLVGHVGRFSPQKNHEFLIDIFKSVLNIIPSKLILVGDGELRTHIEEKVKKLGIKDNVIFAGVRSDVCDLMQAMDVFVFPSHYEGLPVTLVEAQASDLPCIISDKISIECKLTEKIKQLGLSDDLGIWAQEIVNASKARRTNTGNIIKNVGFDIKKNAELLENYYISKIIEIMGDKYG